MSFAPGERVGRYHLLTRLAVGGMAEIFLARATGIKGFEKLVVLKRILPHRAGDGRFVRMFVREARLAATLDHLNIAHVHDIGRVGGTYFFTMEYVHGAPLAAVFTEARRRDQPIPLEHAISIVLGAASGLHYAHDKRDNRGIALGLVHRDISPSNVLVGYDGAIKLVDFGIAKANHDRSETRPGSLKGTIAYMSPEQCRGETLDRRSDIFALGILLYELTTMTYLFEQATDALVVRQILEGTLPPPSSRRADYPPELERIVMRALAASPDARYPTAAAFGAELEAFAHRFGVPLSARALAEYVSALFERDVEAWRSAERAGVSLADHLTATAGDRTCETDLDVDETFAGLDDLEEVAPADSLPPPTPARRARRKLIAGIALGVALGASALGVTIATRESPAASPAWRATSVQPGPAVDPPPPPAAPAAVTAAVAPSPTLPAPSRVVDAPQTTAARPIAQPPTVPKRTVKHKPHSAPATTTRTKPTSDHWDGDSALLP